MIRSHFRYSQTSFQNSVLAALGLTLIVSFLVWLFSQLLGFRHYNSITAVSAIIFFGFCSAAMIWSYLRREIVLAARPDGLFDLRYSRQAVPWDRIKDLRLGRVENDFQLYVYLWPEKLLQIDEKAEFVIDLASLDAGVDQILAALSAHKSVTILQG